MNIYFISVIVIIYMFIVGFLAYYGYKGTKSAADYLIAGRDTHPYVMALSYGATFVSTSAIIGFGGAAAVFGLGLLWLPVLNIIVGIFIAFVFFGKRTRHMSLNMGAHTFPEFLGRRFDSRFLQGAGGALIFIAMPLYASVVLMGASKFMAHILGIPYTHVLFFFTAIITVYVIMGGMKGVMYTDAFQGTLMFLGMLLLVGFTYHSLGGVIPAHQKLTEMAPLAVDMFGANGHRGWTAFPAFASETWFVVVTSLCFGVGIGVLAQPQLVVRFMTLKSDKELHRAVLAGGVFILVMTGGPYLVGALSNAYFMEHPDFHTIALLAADKNVADIIPLYIKTSMPQWFTALFMVTLLSAAMSTLSSQFHAMGTSIGRDLYEKAFGGKGSPILITQMGILIGILLSLFIAWGLPLFFEGGTAIIARGTAIFFGLCASAFLPIYVGAIYSTRMTKAGAIAGFLTGFAASFFWLFFMHIKESKPLLLCKTLFGVDSLAEGTMWALMDPLVIALPLSILATIVVSRLSSPMDDAYVDSCFAGLPGRKS